jgi:hypothetical protein
LADPTKPGMACRLRQAQRENADDRQTLSYLADLYKGRRDDRTAMDLYERLFRVDPTQVSAPAALGAPTKWNRVIMLIPRAWRYFSPRGEIT